MSYQGLFVGLTTLDCIYLSDRYLAINQKIVAQDYLTVAGGPATNAAVAFNYFDNQSKLLTVLGQHSISQLIRDDLESYQIEILDLIPQKRDSPPLSAIMVMSNTGDRSVISINAQKSPAKPDSIPQAILAGIDIILIDGHQIEVSLAIITAAKANGIPIVMDGGSWKPGLEVLLAQVDYAICSANFYPPGCNNTAEVIGFLQHQGIEYIAITQGQQPIKYCDRQTTSISNINVPSVNAQDTLGAGDIFHGAFCHHILQQDFSTALSLAAQTASKSCQYFGTRSWMIKE